MFCHNKVMFPGEIKNVNLVMRQLAQCGVDIFFLLSGLGCYYSLSKNNLISFYRNRVLRIIPAYLIVMIIGEAYYIGICHEKIGTFCDKYSLTAFFTEASLTVWFVSAILITYLISPLLIRLVKRDKIFIIVMLIFCFLIVVTEIKSYSINRVVRIINSIWIARLPAYMLGMYLAKCINKNKTLNNTLKNCLIVLGIMCIFIETVLFVLNYSWRWTVNRLLFLPTCLAIIFIYIALDEKSKLIHNMITPIFVWLGSMTLEIYLIHEKMIILCNKYIPILFDSIFRQTLVVNFVACILAIVGAYLLNRLISSAIKIFKKENV